MPSLSFAAVWTSVFGPAVTCASGESRSYGADGTRSTQPNRDVVRHDASSSPSGFTVVDGVPTAQLVAQLAAGSRDALTTLHRALYVPLWRYAVMITGDAGMAEEILQDVFFSLWCRRERLGPNLDVRAYLYAAVRNQARGLHRHARVVHDVEIAVDRGILALPAFGHDAMAPDAQAEAHEFSEAFRRAIDSLTEREREALQLRVEDDLTFDEIGRLLGLSKMGAHKLVARAEGKVRALLAEYRP